MNRIKRVEVLEDLLFHVSLSVDRAQDDSLRNKIFKQYCALAQAISFLRQEQEFFDGLDHKTADGIPTDDVRVFLAKRSAFTTSDN